MTNAIAYAQTASTGTISGTVTDANGAVVAGAEIELRNTATGQNWKQSSNDSGRYNFSNVSPGQYAVSVTMQGFRKETISKIEVNVTKSYTVNVSLMVGNVIETIEVDAGTVVELQKNDATIGNVLSGKLLLYLPSVNRSASDFVTLQPTTIQEAGDNDNGNLGGTVAGARTDQSTFTLDGIDITEITTAGGAGFRTILPLPVDSIEEFRIGVTNLNASFTRGSGGQVALIGKRGSNEFHGAGYWYLQNDALNANSWTNDRTGIEKPEQRDNRYGVNVGGPIAQDKTFFFVDYEGRDFTRSFDVSRIVPTSILRQGIVRFRDATGNIVSYNVGTSTLCGTTNNQHCDPRGLGLSPTVSALWSLLPAGNDPSSGDGLNTIGWRSTARAPLDSNYFVNRLDHRLTSNWQMDGSVTYFRRLQTLGGDSAARQQLDIRQGNAVFLGNSPLRDQNVTIGLTGTISPSFTSDFRFGWSRDRQASQNVTPSDVAKLLAIPGDNSSAGPIALNIGGGMGDQTVSEPIDVDASRARSQKNDNQPFQFVYDGAWITGHHTFQFGASEKYVISQHTRNDKVVGSLSSLDADIFRGNNIAIPATSRPPTCSATVHTNCLQPSDVSQWDTLFAGTTGMVDTIGVLAVRDSNLNSLPLGSSLTANATYHTPEFYFEDRWQTKRSLTLSLGLSYGWQTPPHEREGRQTLMIDNTTGSPITYDSYINARRQAALKGDIYNPQIAFEPINSSGRDGVFNTDWNNFAPRLAAAWNPAFNKGILKTVFGDRASVLRAGFGIVYDRINSTASVITPTLGVGFGQTISIRAPACNSTGSGGAACNPSGASPVADFRVGIDGLIPIPAVPTVGIPVVPSQPFGEMVSFQIDPNFKVGKSYNIDVTLQRELPGGMIMELAYVGRLARNLPASVNLNSAPIFQLDPKSGQTFAQAFDTVAQALRSGVPTANIPNQPWFQDLMPGGTSKVVTGNEANFINGNVSSVFQTIDLARRNQGLTPFDNLETMVSFMRTSIGKSNYHAFVATLRKRLSKGLTFDFNYTFSKSLDEIGGVQNTMSVIPSAFFPDFDYGPSDFDRTHVVNAVFMYELPTGRGHRLGFNSRLNSILDGWEMLGVFRASSGLPLTVSEGVPALGGGSMLTTFSAAIPIVDPNQISTGVNNGVAGSNNIGTNGNPAAGGSGVNIFSDPASVFNDFRRILISQDQRSGRANPLRGFGIWNLDVSVGKTTKITERVQARLSFDFFNVFNHPTFSNPVLSLTSASSFGVVTQETVPTQRESDARWIQVGLRLQF